MLPEIRKDEEVKFSLIPYRSDDGNEFGLRVKFGIGEDGVYKAFNRLNIGGIYKLQDICNNPKETAKRLRLIADTILDCEAEINQTKEK